ncbi:hypothetical protein FOV68_22435 [Pantoea sp. paga]|nr:hypothetical protein FOV68_22435 [Pantoea sp. paga]
MRIPPSDRITSSVRRVIVFLFISGVRDSGQSGQNAPPERREKAPEEALRNGVLTRKGREIILPVGCLSAAGYLPVTSMVYRNGYTVLIFYKLIMIFIVMKSASGK